MYMGRPETYQCWYPGYAWTICSCGSCGSHLGWRYNAVQVGLHPAVFWGLRRASLLMGPPEAAVNGLAVMEEA